MFAARALAPTATLEQPVELHSNDPIPLAVFLSPVEFANRDKLSNTVNKILEYSKYLIDSYDTTNVLKNGIEVVISGKPNVG